MIDNLRKWIPLYANAAIVTNTRTNEIHEYELGDVVTVISYNYLLNLLIYNHRTSSLMEIPKSFLRSMKDMSNENIYL